MWNNETTTQENKTTDYLNIALVVQEATADQEEVVVHMPLNCPIDMDLRGLSANQRKLFELLQEKIDQAKSDEDLVIQVPVRAKLYRKDSKEADSSGWTVKL